MKFRYFFSVKLHLIHCYSSDDLKVCTYCSKIVLSYLNKSAINSDLKSDLQALQADLSSKLSAVGQNSPSSSASATTSHHQHPTTGGGGVHHQGHRKISVGYQEERLVSNLRSTLSNADRRSILQQSKSLKTLYDDMSKRMSDQPHRGSDMIQFMIANQNASNQVQAIAILNAMREAGFIEPTIEPTIRSFSVDELIEFKETETYRLLSLVDDEISTVGGYSEVDMDSSLFHLRRGGGGGGATNHDDEEQHQQQLLIDSFGFSTSSDFETKSSLLSTAGSKSLLEAFCSHEELLLSMSTKNNIFVHFSRVSFHRSIT